MFSLDLSERRYELKFPLTRRALSLSDEDENDVEKIDENEELEDDTMGNDKEKQVSDF